MPFEPAHRPKPQDAESRLAEIEKRRGKVEPQRRPRSGFVKRISDGRAYDPLQSRHDPRVDGQAEDPGPGPERADYELQSLKSYYRQDWMKTRLAPFFDNPLLETEWVINVGCGRGESLVGRPRWRGIDFNEKLVPLWEEMGLMGGFGNGENGVASVCDAGVIGTTSAPLAFSVSTDFFEHLPPERLEFIIRELHRVAPRGGLHVIDLNTKSANKGVDGRNLHLSGFSVEHWEHIFGGALEAMGKMGRISARTSGRHAVISWGELA